MKRTHHASVLSTTSAALLIMLAASFSPTPAAAQMTAEQACSGDAQRLCGQFIPDRQTTGACMARLRSQLSPACAAFFKPAKSTRKSPRHRRHS
jgi:hypothetical protein